MRTRRAFARGMVGTLLAVLLVAAASDTTPNSAAPDRVGPTGVRPAAVARPAAVTERAATAQPVGHWTRDARTIAGTAHAGQGVAVITAPDGVPQVLTRGNADVLAALARKGWVHIGDPDAHDGYVIDAYQGRRDARAKMFLVTTPGGRQVELAHPLVAGEHPNNSFAAVSPDARWLVSGEWGTVTRLLVFRLPPLTPDLSAATLRLDSAITLTHPVRDLQGCSFASGVVLLCATNDPGTDLYGVARQVLGVQLDRPLGDRGRTGVPRLLFAVPDDGSCRGAGETEGLDVTAGVLRLAVIEPGRCRTTTVISRYVENRV